MLQINRITLFVKGMCLRSRDLFFGGEIDDNISETVQDKDIFAMED